MLRGLQVQAPLLTELFILHLGGIVKEKRHHTVSAINNNIPIRLGLKLNRGIHKNTIVIYMDDSDFTSFSTVVQSYLYQDDVVVVVLLFYVHGKHLRSCRDGQLT